MTVSAILILTHRESELTVILSLRVTVSVTVILTTTDSDSDLNIQRKVRHSNANYTHLVLLRYVNEYSERGNGCWRGHGWGTDTANLLVKCL